MTLRIIAGPCQHEDYYKSMEIATQCKRICDKHGIEYIFKASFDKANRTSIDSKRGVGLKNTLSDFRGLKNKIPDLKCLTDVHNISEIVTINSWNSQSPTIDVLQIPAFLCRQTDLIVAAVKSGLTVNIKKGQFLAPWDVKGILSKTKNAKPSKIWITERGTSFGYNTLVNDFTGMRHLLDDLGSRFVYDVTHSVQKPGGNGTSSGGNREYVPHLCRAGAALGVTSFFLEVHADPDNAPSDGPNMLHLRDFDDVCKQIKVVSNAANGWTWL